MKKGLNAFAILLAVILGLTVGGCGQRIEKFGDTIDDSEPRAAIASILVNPQKYIDKIVIIEGTIASECPSGGFINVRDNSGGTIYVEMHTAPFAPIPQRAGALTTVKGLVYQNQGQARETKILCKGLVIK